MKYALPCVSVLVKRGTVTQEHLESLIETVKDGGEAPTGAEKIPAVAFAVCSLIALENGKAAIDDDIIREYFLFRHDDMIDKRYEEMGDFDTDACRTRIGRIVSIDSGRALVEMPGRTKTYRTDFVPDVKVNDRVVTHWDFIVETVDGAIAKQLETRKKQSVDQFTTGLRNRGILIGKRTVHHHE